MHNVERLLNIFNYFDGMIVTDDKGIINYYSNMRTDIYDLKQNEIIGKSILEIHPWLTEETSSIMRVLKYGKPIYNQIEHLTTKHGQNIDNLYSTLPIIRDGKIIGAVDYSRCIGQYERQGIVLQGKHDKEKIGLYSITDIITKSALMKSVKLKITKVSNTNSPVLIYGETGTGKEMFAQAIHTYSNRHEKKFISINCAAIPSNLLESTLFGTLRGSYTGAENRSGLFEVANGGTLFLDEINCMELNMQAKILKAIEEKKVMRLGSTQAIHIDIKIISAVNEDPLTCVKEKRLREDLYYRLNVVQINIPPLRERVADIKYLTEHFISTYNMRMNKSVLGISDEVAQIFMHYNWPGNVREFKNVIEGAFNIIGSRVIQKIDLPCYLTDRFEKEKERLQKKMAEMSLEEKIKSYEKKLIIETLDACSNISEAARKLNISKQCLNYKLIKYKLKE